MAHISLDKELSDAEFEKLFLDSLLHHKDKDKLLHNSFPSLFSVDLHRKTFGIIKGLNGKADIVSTCKILETKYLINQAVSADIFMSIDRYMADHLDPWTVLQFLKEMLYRRIIIDKASNMMNVAESSPPLECAGQIAIQTAKLLAVERILLRSKRSSSDELAEITASRINTDGDVVRTGHPFINKRLYGLTRSSLSSLLAQPSHLKSTYTDHLISSTVEKYGYTGLIISLEDSKEERVKRIIASRLDVSLKAMRFKRAKVPQEDIEKVLKVNLHDRLTILDSGDVVTPEEACNAIMDLKPDIVAIDHIQEFQVDDMVLGLIRAVRSLKTAAVRCNCHIIIASQVSDKKFTGRESKAPTAADAQWTSALRQASSEMFALYYPIQDTKNEFQKNLLQLHFLKSRFAHTIGMIELEVDPDKGLIIGEFPK